MPKEEGGAEDELEGSEEAAAAETGGTAGGATEFKFAFEFSRERPAAAEEELMTTGDAAEGGRRKTEAELKRAEE
jgi:hypothetical protein